MSAGTPDVAVVVVNYRTAPLTSRCLEALRSERQSSGLDLRVVVVENDSGDEDALRRALGDDPSMQLVVAPHNGGFGAGNNLGVAALRARGVTPRYVHFLNPDTEVRPGAVAALVRFLDAHPRAGIASGVFEHADGTPWRHAFRFPSALSELEQACHFSLVTRLLHRHVVARDMGDVAERVDWPSGASMMFRREVLEATGGFDEAFFLYFEEIDLCRRALQAGWECWYVPDSRVMHVRGQSTGVTSLDGTPRRLPRYWFESRRHYFVKHHGVAHAALADAMLLLGMPVGWLKDVLKRQPRVPHLALDVLRHSVVWPSNRRSTAGSVPPERDSPLGRLVPRRP